MLKRGWVDGPRNGSSLSRRAIMDSVFLNFANSSAALFIILDGRYDESSQAQRSVDDLSSITLKLLKCGYRDYFSDLHDEAARRTVMAATVRHTLRNPTLGQTTASSFNNFTTLPATDCHRQDGPSQAL
ncbi:hypothetical protein EJD97_009121 [Solanum chilense]|uniref:Uncharacterized protein n=1 Tax=Solanum chilense TaxID=4083 RepID=A0A6N2BNQ3_SOLCI|nr:hypothetical protein EJD97_009121 [Solanum chilense]